jgi:ACT domain-containing protein
MSILIKAQLPDIPGTLIRMLKPISDNSGNISSVIHSHEDNSNGKIPVIVQFELPGEVQEEKLKIITEELESLSIEINEITQVLQRQTLIVILIGHVFETDFVDTYKRISEAGGILVNLNGKFTKQKEVSTVKFEIECDHECIPNLMEEIKIICKEKNLSLISDR